MAIVLPARGLAGSSSEEAALGELARLASDRLRHGGGREAPPGIELEQPVDAGGQTPVLRGHRRAADEAREDRERMGLGIKAYRLIEATLPR